MNEIIRRIAMMIGIVAVGTILIFFNTSIYITLLAALAFGVIMAMGLGLLKIEDFKKIREFNPKNIFKKKSDSTKSSEKNTPKKEKKQKDKKSFQFKSIASRFHKDETDKKNKPSPKKEPGRKKISAGLSAALGSFHKTIDKTRDDTHSEKLDSLINTTINEPAISPLNDSPSQSEKIQSDDTEEFSDEMDFFNEEDFESLNSLEIDGEDMPFSPDTNSYGESLVGENNNDDLNMDDEINSILFAGNAPDEFDEESFNNPDTPVSPASVPKEANIQDASIEEDLFNTEEFFVQGIEDGLDEESFINIPDAPTENQPSVSLNDPMDELNNIPEFENINLNNDEFSDFNSINLDELDTDDLSIETDEIIIEEEEIEESDILPDDFIPSTSENTDTDKNLQGTDTKNSPFGNPSLTTPEIDMNISFSGNNEYDDILNVLESDIKTAKTGPEPSLVRDMKDINVEAKDLVRELETILGLMGGKPSETNHHNDRSEE